MGKRYVLLEEAMKIVGELPVERTFDAVRVVVPVPKTGEIDEAWIYHVERRATYSSADFPVEIPKGDRIAVNIRGKNTSEIALQLKITVELRDPDGIVRQKRDFTRWTGAGLTIESDWTLYQVLDKPGTWVIFGRLEEV